MIMAAITEAAILKKHRLPPFQGSGHTPLKVPNNKFDFDVGVHHIHRMHECYKPNVE